MKFNIPTIRHEGELVVLRKSRLNEIKHQILEYEYELNNSTRDFYRIDIIEAELKKLKVMEKLLTPNKPIRNKRSPFRTEKKLNHFMEA